MSRRRQPLAQFALALMALWLGLWPAADAVTGTSQVMVMEPDAPAAIPNCAARHCLLAEAATLDCCQLANESAAPEANCCGRTREQCARYFSLGGLVLFTVQPWTLEPDLAPSGTVTATIAAGESRTLQPPVPPPWTAS